MFTIDAHLDLSMNALEWNRDLTLSVSAINAREKGMSDKPDRGNAIVSLPALREGNIGLVVATQIARYVAPGNSLPGWNSPAQAWAQSQGQLAWYQTMVQQGEMAQITNLVELDAHLALWENGEDNSRKPVGFILSLEGADSIVTVDYLEKAYEYGLRALGPAHYGPGRYAHGTDASAPLNAEGKALIRKMDELGIILDTTHLCDLAFWEALEIYNGPVWASHNNCRALVDHNRQFSDEMIKALVDRGAVIGAAMDAWMLSPGWERGKSTPKERNVTLNTVLDHMEHICQIAGNANHIGIGSDLDGAFGTEQSPHDINTITDLNTIAELLRKRGFTEKDIAKVMHGNWLKFLRKAWS
ncbi:membrane dipeptidase [Algoriphagus ratkowskyi]|uniref:Membrane dipeptidase n=1 Tax=Algoriphagus ratkowskyi TaxID=57028 RepID=A0A2W7R1G7_9BACT|nr:membrane dipeptidase [Algoriphagus ratkowskyi]PZX54683.1 membrane dipeptidase [Algoriphagus ratkowskyi]TXD76995.1 peptidase M19 [Algoriphagus ratkowskyi]